MSARERRDACVQLSDHLWLNQEQIGVLGLFAGGGDQRMRLAAVMRLVIEEMRDEQPVRRALTPIRAATSALEAVRRLLGDTWPA